MKDETNHYNIFLGKGNEVLPPSLVLALVLSSLLRSSILVTSKIFTLFDYTKIRPIIEDLTGHQMVRAVIML